ncbi:MAG: M67 family peptidase [Candidatus Acididesulfobacter diazotrophicus]|jgi:proteasome lid subunit RPN8/RPN11|uniref:M67 family peptidase n=1 Tax=Candidatus Acididesulfobacter diazotrophicus TaxID=2597226 RepID=A0A519BM13_9DELT|nr:MAG: M67 family peptidase [Candidatus Acididesulfobacter diazotrophicus]
MPLIILKQDLEIIKKHIAEIFPYEACGALLGIIDGNDKKITKVFPANNKYRKIAWDAFEIEPKDMLEIDKLSRKNNIEVLGFYHSHPNHPAIPSNTDINASWPYYSYMIVSVKGNNLEDIADIKNYLMPDKINKPLSEEIIIAE